MLFDPIDADALAQTVSDLVAIRSLSGAESGVADFVRAWLTRAGVQHHRDGDGNILALIEPHTPGDAAQTLHLNGHMDTVVPVGGWQSDPLRPQILGTGDERRIVGLGASDMKSGLAVMLHLASAFSDASRRFQKLRLAFSFTTCEEGPVPGKRNGVHAILARQPGRWAITLEASCDSISPTLTVGCQGHAVARVTIHGRAAHSANPDLGANAIHAAAEIARRVAALHRSYADVPVIADLRARPTIAVTQITGGSAPNIIPDLCELTISRRIAPGETLANAEREVEQLTSGLDGVTITSKLRCDAPACMSDKNGPLLQAASAASRELFGQARYSWNRARTDMVLFKQAGMDVLNIGPGFCGQAHAAGEYARVVDMLRAGNLLARTIERMDQPLAP
ncbi:MAG TPA: M20/M25/M40 family metallo-hydrolase [Planctomycetota bacterium]|jgi:succinyl-diaminopimelate desuccinylase